MPLFTDILLAIAMLHAVHARSLPCVYDMGLQQVLAYTNNVVVVRAKSCIAHMSCSRRTNSVMQSVHAATVTQRACRRHYVSSYNSFMLMC